MTMQLPLAFTYQTVEEWVEDIGVDTFFVLNLNGVEILREKARFGAGLVEAEEWAQDLFARLLDNSKDRE